MTGENQSKSNSVLVVGAGILGASVAFRLAKAGRDVTLIDSIGPHTGASGRSWAWINAVAADTDAYAKLRLEGIAAYHRLESDLNGALEVDWTGSVLWDPYLFDPSVDYSDRPGIEPVDRAELAALEPMIAAPPEQALSSSEDGLVDGAHAVAAIVTAASEAGAHLAFGHEVDEVMVSGGRSSGVRCGPSVLRADTVVLCTGIGTAPLLAPLGYRFPTANRAGLLITTAPVSSRLNRAIWTETVHIKQLRCGRLVIGEGAHEEGALADPNKLAQSMISKVEALLPGLGPLQIDHTTVATRPIPGDGYPAVGPVPGVDGLYVDGLYMAVTHSGFTLGAVVGELVAQEITSGEKSELLTPFRPDRFAAMTGKGSPQ